MSHPIYIHDNTEAIEIERKAYHGGRVTPFIIGQYNSSMYYKLDVNSMYPYVMKINHYPTSLDYSLTDVTLQHLSNYLRTHVIIADVELTTQQDAYPYLMNNRLVFPIGHFRTVLAGNELLYALANAKIHHVFKALVYRARPIFTDYIEYFYALKVQAEQSGNLLRRNQIKLLLNSLYGKFGQTGRKSYFYELSAQEKRIFDCIEDDIRTERGMIKRIGDHILVTEQSGESYNSFPAIAACVTANARILLYQYILKAGRENVFYCDTDSLIVNSEGFERLRPLVSQNEIGKLKLEGTAQHIEILAPKDYVFGDEIKRKGIPKNATQNGNDSYEVVYWPKLLSQSTFDDKADYVNKIVTKQLKREVLWGIPAENGIVLPFTLP